MSCPECNGKGFIEGWRAESNRFTPSIEQCPKRCNIKGYSAEIQRRLNNPAYVTERPILIPQNLKNPKPSFTTIIPFPQRRGKDDGRDDAG